MRLVGLAVLRLARHLDSQLACCCPAAADGDVDGEYRGELGGVRM